MKKKALFNGGHHNIEIAANWIVKNSEEYTIYIYLSLYNKLLELDYSEIEKLYENKQIFTIDFESLKADFLLEDVIVKCYPYAYMHIIDPIKIKKISPKYEKIPGARLMTTLSRDSYKDIYELVDLAISQALKIDWLVYMDFRIWQNLFSETSRMKMNNRGEGFIKLMSSTTENYIDAKRVQYNIVSYNYDINKPFGVNEAIIRRLISNENLKITTIELLKSSGMMSSP